MMCVRVCVCVRARAYTCLPGGKPASADLINLGHAHTDTDTDTHTHTHTSIMSSLCPVNPRPGPPSPNKPLQRDASR